MFGSIPAVSAAVNKKANSILQTGWEIKDRYNFPNKDLTRHIQSVFDLSGLVERASKQYDIYTTVFYLKYQDRDKKDPNILLRPNFQLVPASELSLYYAKSTDFTIRKFYWQSVELPGMYTFIEKFDSFGDQTFHVGKSGDTDSIFFGAPRLRSLFTLLDGLLLDDQNYKTFLRNASFPGIIVLTTEDISTNTQMEIESAFRSLRDPDTRFKANTIAAYQRDQEGNIGKTVDFVTLSQKIENRLTLAEKQEIAGQVYDNLFIPRKVMGLVSSGMGANEYETAMLEYKLNAIDPQMSLIDKDINTFVLPAILRYLESTQYFERQQIKIKDVDGLTRTARAEDFHFAFKEFSVESPSLILDKGLKLFEAGAITNRKLLTDYAGLEDDNLPLDLDWRKIKSSEVVYKDGSLKDAYGDVVSTEDIEGSQETTDNAEKNDNSDDSNDDMSNPSSRQENIQEMVEKAMEFAKSRKVKAKIKSFFSKAVETDKEEAEKFSKIPNVIKTPEAKQLQELIEKDLLKQYTSIDIDKILKNPEVRKFLTPKILSDDELQDQAKQKAVNINLKKIIQDIIDKTMPGLKFDLSNFSKLLAFFGKLGNEEALSEAPQEIQDLVTPENRVSFQNILKSFIAARLGNLLKGKPAKDTFGYDYTPYYDGNLNDTSKEDLAQIISEVIGNNPELSGNELKRLIDTKIKENVKMRAETIMIDNVARAYGAGVFAVGINLEANGKKWLRTSSSRPRNAHLAQVGEIVPYNETFSDGSFWSGELINCLCGIQLVWTTDGGSKINEIIKLKK
jgi:hypothetical protein